MKKSCEIFIYKENINKKVYAFYALDAFECFSVDTAIERRTLTGK